MVEGEMQNFNLWFAIYFNYCLIHGVQHMFFARFILQNKESWVNYTWSIYFQFFLMNCTHHDLKNRNFDGESWKQLYPGFYIIAKIVCAMSPAFWRSLTLLTPWRVQDVKMEL